VTVGGNDELLSNKLVARDLNWIAIATLREPMRVSAKIRHRHEPARRRSSARRTARRWSLRPAAARHHSGTAVVFYDGDVVVGGGWIAETKKN